MNWWTLDLVGITIGFILICIGSFIGATLEDYRKERQLRKKANK